MKRAELTGQRFGSWLVLGPAESQRYNIRWSCRCDCGVSAVVQAGHLIGGYSTKCRPCASRKAGIASGTASALSDAEVTYMAVHARLRTQRGRAGDQTCTCGKPAYQWAYLHDDPQERTCRDGRPGREQALLAFTPNLNAYVPMCVPCHRRLDQQHAPVNNSVRLVNGVPK